MIFKLTFKNGKQVIKSIYLEGVSHRSVMSNFTGKKLASNVAVLVDGIFLVINQVN